MEKILIIHTNGMGDFIMFTPALKLLKASYPTAQIDILITNHNLFNFIKEQKFFINIYSSDLKFKNLLKIGFHLRKKYDLSFFTVGGKIWKNKLFSFLLKSKMMIGESNSSFFRFPYKKSILRDDYSHFVDRNIRLVKLLSDRLNSIESKPSLEINPISEEKIQDFIKKNHLQDKILFGIHPGCQEAYAARRWPEKYFSHVINELEKISKIKCLVFLGPEDIEVGKYLKQNTGAIFIENFELNDVIALISKCRYFFNTDSGLGHIFTCFNSRIFSIFGPNQIKEMQELRTGPYSRNRIILKIENKNKKYYLKKDKNGVYQCLIDLKPEVVIERIQQELLRDGIR